MDEISIIKSRINEVIDPICNQTLGENNSVKHVGIDENNAVGFQRNWLGLRCPWKHDNRQQHAFSC